MDEINSIKSNFEMGFITPHEFVNQLSDYLFLFGVAGELEDVVNETLLPLVNFIKDEVFNAPGNSKKQIRDFLKKEG